MDTDQKWAAIAAERRALADLLDGLTDAQWEQASLCTQWRVRSVAAHVALTPQSPGVGRILLRGVRARGDFDGLNRDLAREHAVRPPARLVAELKDLATCRDKPAITTLGNLVFDTLVHAQDIAVPLGLTHAMPLEAAHEGVGRVWRMGWPFWAKRRMRGIRLQATDVDWSAGSGEELQGPVQAILLLLTGRGQAALPHLRGAGADLLARRSPVS